jgi:hypothetical protein
MSDEPFLSRWSRRKNAAKTASEAQTEGPTADAVLAQAASEAGFAGPTADAVPAPAGTQSPPLPPVDSLTPESDFTAFMKPEVDPALKRDAFKKLITDPRYNVMDGLDVYIDDYSKPDPLPDGWLEKMNQVKHLGIFREDPVEEIGALDEDRAADAEAMPADPIAFPPEALSPDTSSGPVPPPEVGKSEVLREGN